MKEQADFPQPATMCGFPFYDKLDATLPSLDPDLDAFLRSGEPPYVFTLVTHLPRRPRQLRATHATRPFNTIHQGGIGTTAQALRVSKPMIVVPYSHHRPQALQRNLARSSTPRGSSMQ